MMVICSRGCSTLLFLLQGLTQSWIRFGDSHWWLKSWCCGHGRAGGCSHQCQKTCWISGDNLACLGAMKFGISGIDCKGVACALLVVVPCWLISWGSGRGGRGWVRYDMVDGCLCWNETGKAWILLILQKNTESPQKSPCLKFCGLFCLVFLAHFLCCQHSKPVYGIEARILNVSNLCCFWGYYRWYWS